MFKGVDAPQLQSYIDTINEIQSATNQHNSALFDSLQIQEYATALSDMEPKQAALLLSTQGLSNAQIQQTLATQGLNAAQQYQALLDAGLLKSKQKLTNVELQNNIIKALSATMSEEEAVAKAKEIMASMGLAIAKEGEDAQTVKLTGAKLAELAATGQLTGAQAQEIATRTGVLVATQAQNTAAPAWIANMKAMALATWEQVKATAAWLVTNPAGWATLAVTGIAALTAIIWKWHDAITVTLEEQKEKLEEAKAAFESAKTELNELESEIQKNTDAIEELEALPNLSWVDQEELDKLKETTRELELQKQLKKENETKAAETLYKENKNTVEKEFSDFSAPDVSGLKEQLSSGDVTVGRLVLESDPDDMTALLASYQYLNEEKAKLTDANEIKEYDSYIGSLDDTIREKLTSLYDYKQNIRDIASGRELTADEQEMYDYLTSMQRTIYEFYSPAAWNTISFDSIFDTNGLEKTKEELIAMFQAGELTPEVLESFPKLNAAIKDSELIMVLEHLLGMDEISKAEYHDRLLKPLFCDTLKNNQECPSYLRVS